jgi:hypothetical protein
MRDLTEQVRPLCNLVPSSMSAGGEVHFDNKNLQMTAPGSQPVSAPSEQFPGQAPETLPLPIDTQQIPVSNVHGKLGNRGPGVGEKSWMTPTGYDAGTWKETNNA